MNILPYLPGWVLLAIIAYGSKLLSKTITMGGKHPLEAAVIAILIGVLLTNFKLIPELAKAGVKKFEKLLILGIVAVGAGLNFNDLLPYGAKMLIIIVTTMLIGFLCIYSLSKILKLPTALAALLALGTTICGGTAIAVAAPVIKAKEEETSYAIGTIALWGLLAIILYPKIAQLIGVSDFHFGIFAGTAIHSTPQVVGAGYIFSQEAGEIATTVKLIRNCFLAPAVMLLSLWYFKKEEAHGEKRGDIRRAFPWFLFAYFIMAGLNTQGVFSAEMVKSLTTLGKFLILVGMVGVGMNTQLGAFKSVGAKPLLVGFVGSLVVAVVSCVLISVLF